MESESQLARHLRFGAFEVDVVQRELRRQGLKVKLNEKPFQVLQVLLERAGDVVRREDLRQRLWSADTYVDFDANLNTALSNLRRALGDSTENPVFVETVPRQGYRFIAPVSKIDHTSHVAADLDSETSRAQARQAIGSRVQRNQFPAFVSAAVLFSFLFALGTFAYFHWGSRSAQANATPRKVIILVTPFENLSGDPSQNYLSDGLTDEMITRLGQSSPEHLGVIARSTAMEYQGERKSLDKIVREQHVDYILEGTFQRQDDHVRITAQLYKASDLSSVWAEQYERDAANLLAIQSDVANRITQSLSLKLLPATPAHKITAPVDPKAYDAYLKGLFQCNRLNSEGAQRGVQFFQQAIHIEPGFAPAYAALASCLHSSYFLGFLSSGQAHEQAKSAAQKALALDDSLVDAHLTLASILYEYDWNWPAAEKEFRRALELNPSSVKGCRLYAGYLMFAGRFDEALTEIRKAQQLDPASLQINSMLGLVYVNARQYVRAAQQCKEVMDLDPNFSDAHYCVGLAYYYQKQYSEALSEFKKSLDLDPDPTQDLVALGATHAAMGDRKDATQAIDELTRRSKQHYVSAYGIADIYNRLGEKDQAFASLKKALAERSSDLLLLATDPDFDDLHQDPRFRQMVLRIGFPNSTFATYSPTSAAGR